jgi:proteasome lid subunit RPN8/RPN11
MDRRQVPRGQPDPSADHRVVIPANLAGALLSYLREAGEHERGGVLLGRRDEVATWVSIALFPPQLLHDRIACSFDVGCLNVIHTAKDMLDGELTERIGTIVGWVHSHPGHGLFLSRTDVDTLSAWRQLDPKAVAVVADPYNRGLMGERIAWWRVPGRGRAVTLDQSRGAILTIRQVALVAEAINQSADPDTRWDIVTPRAVMRIMVNSASATPLASGQDPSRTQVQDQGSRRRPAQEPRRSPGEEPGQGPGQDSRDSRNSRDNK